MAVLRSVIELALDELVSNWEGMRFLSAAMVYSSPRRCSGSGDSARVGRERPDSQYRYYYSPWTASGS
jgi:hypothetical protein